MDEDTDGRKDIKEGLIAVDVSNSSNLIHSNLNSAGRDIPVSYSKKDGIDGIDTDSICNQNSPHLATLSKTLDVNNGANSSSADTFLQIRKSSNVGEGSHFTGSELSDNSILSESANGNVKDKEIQRDSGVLFSTYEGSILSNTCIFTNSISAISNSSSAPYNESGKTDNLPPSSNANKDDNRMLNKRRLGNSFSFGAPAPKVKRKRPNLPAPKLFQSGSICQAVPSPVQTTRNSDSTFANTSSSSLTAQSSQLSSCNSPNQPNFSSSSELTVSSPTSYSNSSELRDLPPLPDSSHLDQSQTSAMPSISLRHSPQSPLDNNVTISEFSDSNIQTKLKEAQTSESEVSSIPIPSQVLDVPELNLSQDSETSNLLSSTPTVVPQLIANNSECSTVQTNPFKLDSDDSSGSSGSLSSISAKNTVKSSENEETKGDSSSSLTATIDIHENKEFNDESQPHSLNSGNVDSKIDSLESAVLNSCNTDKISIDSNSSAVEEISENIKEQTDDLIDSELSDSLKCSLDSAKVNAADPLLDFSSDKSVVSSASNLSSISSESGNKESVNLAVGNILNHYGNENDYTLPLPFSMEAKNCLESSTLKEPESQSHSSKANDNSSADGVNNSCLSSGQTEAQNSSSSLLPLEKEEAQNSSILENNSSSGLPSYIETSNSATRLIEPDSLKSSCDPSEDENYNCNLMKTNTPEESENTDENTNFKVEESTAAKSKNDNTQIDKSSTSNESEHSISTSKKSSKSSKEGKSKDENASTGSEDQVKRERVPQQKRPAGTTGLSAKPKVKNLRRNIRDIIGEDKLEENTLAAQKEEQLRLQRLQDKQQALRDYMEQQQVERLVAEVAEAAEAVTAAEAVGEVEAADDQVSKEEEIGEFDLKVKKEEEDIVVLSSEEEEQEGDETKVKMDFETGGDELLKPKVEGKSDHEESCCDEAVSEDEASDVSESGSDSDVVVLSHSEEEDNDSDDVNNSGAHVNDQFNVPDAQGRVLVNVGHPEEEEDIFLAPQLSGIVKPHQIGGIRFLYDNIIESVGQYKTSNGFGCILAHSMGLGKTLQVVAFTDIFLRHTEAKHVLIIVPINTLQNWQFEYNQWLPEIPVGIAEQIPNPDFRCRTFKVFILNDAQKTISSRAKVIRDWHETGGVLLMGYELYRQLSLKKPKKSKSKKKRKNMPDDSVVDIEEEDKNKEHLDEINKHLVRPGPDLVICDEGHRIKNAHANISQALKNIRTKRRVVLTGYPLQNNLLEYWCMVDFVRPNYLGTKTEFCNMFERPIQNGQCVDSTPQDVKVMRYRAHVLHSLLEGFVQRRGHSVLAKTLPQKQEHVLLCRLTKIQRTLYSAYMTELKVNKSVANPLKAFAICCKIWNHPDVLYNFVMKKINEDFDLDLDELVGKTPKGKKGAKGDALAKIHPDFLQTSSSQQKSPISNWNTPSSALPPKSLTGMTPHSHISANPMSRGGVSNPVNQHSSGGGSHGMHSSMTHSSQDSNQMQSMGMPMNYGMGMYNMQQNYMHQIPPHPYGWGYHQGYPPNTSNQSMHFPHLPNPYGSPFPSSSQFQHPPLQMSHHQSQVPISQAQQMPHHQNTPISMGQQMPLTTHQMTAQVSLEQQMPLAHQQQASSSVSQGAQMGMSRQQQQLPPTSVNQQLPQVSQGGSLPLHHPQHLLHSPLPSSQNLSHFSSMTPGGGSMGMVNQQSNLMQNSHQLVNRVTDPQAPQNLAPSMDAVNASGLQNSHSVIIDQGLVSKPPSTPNMDRGLSNLSSSQQQPHHDSSMRPPSRLGSSSTIGQSVPNASSFGDPNHLLAESKPRRQSATNSGAFDPDQDSISDLLQPDMKSLDLDEKSNNNPLGDSLRTERDSLLMNESSTSTGDAKPPSADDLKPSINSLPGFGFSQENDLKSERGSSEGDVDKLKEEKIDEDEKKEDLKKDEPQFDWAENLFKEYTPGLLENSIKFQVLFKILEGSIKIGDRLLVFSQSLFTLSMLEEFLQQNVVPGTCERWAKNRSYFRLDGSTTAQEREKLIAEFNANPYVRVFLVSTRAGSLGINLVGANRVIVFDASFNPCHDTQAVCRVYRYGQQKPCHIYRLVTDNSLERRIYDRQVNKQGIADRIVDEMNPDAHLSSKEISNLLADDEEDLEGAEENDETSAAEDDEFEDDVLRDIIKEKKGLFTRLPFKHDSLLIDRKDKKLSNAEKRLAKRSYELEKQANISYGRPSFYSKSMSGSQSGMIGTKIGGVVYAKPVGTVRPMQSVTGDKMMEGGGGSMMHRPNILSRSSNHPVETLAKQGVSVQQITVPKDVSIPTNSGDGKPIHLKAGQSVMVIKTQKGVYLRLSDGKIIAIRTPPEEAFGLPLNQGSVTIVPTVLNNSRGGRGRGRGGGGIAPPPPSRRGRPPMSAQYALGQVVPKGPGSKGQMAVRILRKPISSTRGATGGGKTFQTVAVPVSSSQGALLNKSVVITPAKTTSNASGIGGGGGGGASASGKFLKDSKSSQRVTNTPVTSVSSPLTKGHKGLSSIAGTSGLTRRLNRNTRIMNAQAEAEKRLKAKALAEEATASEDNSDASAQTSDVNPTVSNPDDLAANTASPSAIQATTPVTNSSSPSLPPFEELSSSSVADGEVSTAMETDGNEAAITGQTFGSTTAMASTDCESSSLVNRIGRSGGILKENQILRMDKPSMNKGEEELLSHDVRKLSRNDRPIMAVNDVGNASSSEPLMGIVKPIVQQPPTTSTLTPLQGLTSLVAPFESNQHHQKLSATTTTNSSSSSSISSSSSYAPLTSVQQQQQQQHHQHQQPLFQPFLHQSTSSFISEASNVAYVPPQVQPMMSSSSSTALPLSSSTHLHSSTFVSSAPSVIPSHLHHLQSFSNSIAPFPGLGETPVSVSAQFSSINSTGPNLFGVSSTPSENSFSLPNLLPTPTPPQSFVTTSINSVDRNDEPSASVVVASPHHMEYLNYSLGASTSAFRRPEFPSALPTEIQNLLSPPLGSSVAVQQQQQQQQATSSTSSAAATSSTPAVSSMGGSFVPPSAAIPPSSPYAQFMSPYGSQCNTAFRSTPALPSGYPYHSQYSPYASQYPSLTSHPSLPQASSMSQYSALQAHPPPYQGYHPPPPTSSGIPPPSPYSSSLGGGFGGHGTYPPPPPPPM